MPGQLYRIARAFKTGGEFGTFVAGVEITKQKTDMDELLNEIVVVDVEAPFVYVGTLTAFTDRTLTLTDADVHDLRDSNTPRERYILDSRRDGVRANRHRVFLRQVQVVSISALSDVIE